MRRERTEIASLRRRVPDVGVVVAADVRRGGTVSTRRRARRRTASDPRVGDVSSGHGCGHAELRGRVRPGREHDPLRAVQRRVVEVGRVVVDPRVVLIAAIVDARRQLHVVGRREVLAAAVAMRDPDVVAALRLPFRLLDTAYDSSSSLIAYLPPRPAGCVGRDRGCRVVIDRGARRGPRRRLPPTEPVPPRSESRPRSGARCATATDRARCGSSPGSRACGAA